VFRAVLLLFFSIVVISVLRAVLGIIGKLFSGFSAPAPASSSAQRPAAPLPEALKKDPVCGTFVASSTAIQLTKGGQTYYFCSPACRDKFS